MSGLGTKGKLGILFALEEEKKGLERVLAESRAWINKPNHITTWYLGQLEVYATISGMGREKCELAALEMLDIGVQWMICAGFAAALDQSGQIGDVIVADRILSAHSTDESSYRSDRSLLSALPPDAKNTQFKIHACDLLTVDGVVGSPEQKEQIYIQTGAGALDMESYAAAKVCNERGIPFAAIRAISDTADESIPEELTTLATIQSTWRQLAFLLTKPGIWGDVYSYRRNAFKAASNLGDVLGMMLLRML